MQWRSSCRHQDSLSSPKTHSFAEVMVTSNSSVLGLHQPPRPHTSHPGCLQQAKEGKSPHIPKVTLLQYGTGAHVSSNPWSISTLQSQRVHLPFSCREPRALPQPLTSLTARGLWVLERQQSCPASASDFTADAPSPRSYGEGLKETRIFGTRCIRPCQDLHATHGWIHPTLSSRALLTR